MMERFESEEFQNDHLRRAGTWVIAFLADWCPFCQRFLPEFSALEGEKGFRVAIGDVTSEESPLWDTFHIDVVPTVVVFREGRPVFRADGILGSGLPKEQLERARTIALGQKE
jgi:thioredoxin